MNTYLLPGALREDIQQDIAVSKFTGKRTSMKRLKEEKQLGYGLKPQPDAIPIWSLVSRPDFKLFEQLADFILKQEEAIKTHILEYLEQPDDSKLRAIISELGQEDLSAQATPLTLTDLILKALPATLEELYLLGMRIHLSKKPTAAVRQNIRNLIRQRKAEWKDNLLIPYKGN